MKGKGIAGGGYTFFAWSNRYLPLPNVITQAVYRLEWGSS